MNNQRKHYPLTQPENSYQQIFVDRYTVDGVQVTKVGMENCLLADIDRAIEILNKIKAEYATPVSKTAEEAREEFESGWDAAEHADNKPAPIITLYDDEPAEMTAVLGPKPDPTGWYARSLKQVAENPRLHPQYERPTVIEEPDPPMPKAQKGKDIINVQNVPTKAYKNSPSTPKIDWNADVIRGKSIRIYGLDGNRVRFDKEKGQRIHSTMTFDLTFKIGDDAIYNSYNRTYTGPITSITDKTVTVAGHRLTLHEFIRKNLRYDAAKIAEENANWSD